MALVKGCEHEARQERECLVMPAPVTPVCLPPPGLEDLTPEKTIRTALPHVSHTPQLVDVLIPMMQEEVVHVPKITPQERSPAGTAQSPASEVNPAGDDQVCRDTRADCRLSQASAGGRQDLPDSPPDDQAISTALAGSPAGSAQSLTPEVNPAGDGYAGQTGYLDMVYDELVCRGRNGESGLFESLEDWAVKLFWKALDTWSSLGLVEVNELQVVSVESLEGVLYRFEQEEWDEEEEEEEEAEEGEEEEDEDE